MKGYKRIHGYAQCENCSWDYTDIAHDGRKNYHNKDLGKKAQKHADKTGHIVHVEIGFYKDYKPKRRTG